MTFATMRILKETAAVANGVELDVPTFVAMAQASFGLSSHQMQEEVRDVDAAMTIVEMIRQELVDYFMQYEKDCAKTEEMSKVCGYPRCY
jgi:hypothetical protein